MKCTTLLSFIFLLVACQSSPSSDEMNSSQLSVLICQCSKPILEYNDILRSLAEADDMGKLSKKMAEGDQIMRTAESCITDKVKTSIERLLTADLNQTITNQCQLDTRMIEDILRKLRAFNEVTF